MTDSLISFRLDNLRTGYRRRGHDNILLRDVSAELHAGCLTCLLGANGSGKTTLLRTMAGRQAPLAGRVLLSERDLKDYTSHELSCRVGVVLTDHVPVAGLKAEELVAMGRMPYTGFWGNLNRRDHAVVDEALRMVGMAGFRNRRLGTLSDGERQKLMIAKALAQQTPTILLDEPVAFLDFPSKVDVLTLLRRLAREEGKSILLSIHDLELALQTADCIWLLDGSGSLQVGTPRDLSQRGSLDVFFSGNCMSFNRQTMQYKLDRTDRLTLETKTQP